MPILLTLVGENFGVAVRNIDKLIGFEVIMRDSGKSNQFIETENSSND